MSKESECKLNITHLFSIFTDTSMSSYSHSAIMNSSNACPSTSRQLSSIRLSQHGKPPPPQPQQQQNYRPNVVMAENPKKSYNYMASPNYLQYENTYQKFKNICHNKDVTNFRDNNLNHEQRMIEYRNHDNGNGGAGGGSSGNNGNGMYPSSSDRFTDLEIKAENTMQSSDDEGGFRQNMLYTKNQFNHLNGMNGVNGCNGINGNMVGYNFKEMEPLLHGGVVRESMQKQKYEPPRYANPSALMQNAPNSVDNQTTQSSHNNRFNHQHHHHSQHQHQNLHQHQHHKHGNSPYRKVPPIPAMQPYTKPLPKLPTHIDEGPESSIEDISRPYSPSLSSSNEDILKPTARIGDRGDCDVMENRLSTHNDWLLRSALRNADTNYPQYPQQFGVGSKLNSIDLAYLKDLDLSSTTESPSTLAATNKEVESSTSFEYQENNAIRSPFQREIQRLLDSSASKIAPHAANRTAMQANDVQNAKCIKTNAQNSSLEMNGFMHSNPQNHEFDATQKSSNYMQVLLGGASTSLATVNGKHPVGLEAIKEIAKNSATSDSSQV